MALQLENAEGQTPALGPDGEVSRHSSCTEGNPTVYRHKDCIDELKQTENAVKAFVPSHVVKHDSLFCCSLWSLQKCYLNKAKIKFHTNLEWWCFAFSVDMAKNRSNTLLLCNSLINCFLSGTKQH